MRTFHCAMIFPRSDEAGAVAGSVGPSTSPRKLSHEHLELSHDTT